MNIIETQNLTKSYADFAAVSNVNLHIPKGAVYGFLGPQRCRKIYNNEDVFRTYKTYKRLVYH